MTTPSHGLRLCPGDLLPPVFFVLTYLVTCYLGVILLLWGPTWVRHLYTYYSGAVVPHPEPRQLETLIKLLHWPVLSLVGGYLASIACVRRFALPPPQYAGAPLRLPILLGLWACSVTLALFSLHRGNALDTASNWLSHDYWIASRWHIFATLSYVEFVNLYVLLPISTGLAAFSIFVAKKDYKSPVLLALAGVILSALLFQKKQPLVLLLWVSLPFLVRAVYHRTRVAKISSQLMVGSAALFAFLLFAPTLVHRVGNPLTRGDLTDQDMVLRGSGNQQHAHDATNLRARPGQSKPDANSAAEDHGPFEGSAISDLFEGASLEQTIRGYAQQPRIFQESLYFLNAFLFRTSAPSIFYPLVFPEKHGFEGVDLPFDNYSPDDNLVIWREMWPRTPGGSIMAPMQFSFYAQADVIGAEVLAFVTGITLALCWGMASRWGFENAIGAVGGASVLILSIFLATDSARGSLFASYGVGWGLLFLGALAHFSHATRPNRSRRDIKALSLYDAPDGDEKGRVRDFWNRASCGEELYLPSCQREAYDTQSAIRYKLEPYIEDFAQFRWWKGRRVLEIGTGLGADHERFADAGADLYGIDLTERAIDHTRKRLTDRGLKSRLVTGDAEALPFANESFDLVYSWGVLHHSPNTPKCIKEVFRVLRDGGDARIMVYHKHSLVGWMLWLRYALFAGRPFRSLDDVYAVHLESPGTKAYSVNDVKTLFVDFSTIHVSTVLSHGDLLSSDAGQRHRGWLLSVMRTIWPRPLIRLLLPRNGLFMMICARKSPAP